MRTRCGLFLVSGGLVTLAFPITLVITAPATIIRFMRAFTLKTCPACRKDMARKATACRSCHARLAGPPASAYRAN
jgi:hypothetical protein